MSEGGEASASSVLAMKRFLARYWIVGAVLITVVMAVMWGRSILISDTLRYWNTTVNGHTVNRNLATAATFSSLCGTAYHQAEINTLKQVPRQPSPESYRKLGFASDHVAKLRTLRG